jgi:hypothetical protein
VAAEAAGASATAPNATAPAMATVSEVRIMSSP